MNTPEKLFQPIKIGNMELNNRIVMAPLGIGFTFATEDGSVTDRFIAFYEARAKGGVGLIQLTVAALGRPHGRSLPAGASTRHRPFTRAESSWGVETVMSTACGWPTARWPGVSEPLAEPGASWQTARSSRPLRSTAACSFGTERSGSRRAVPRTSTAGSTCID